MALHTAVKGNIQSLYRGGDLKYFRKFAALNHTFSSVVRSEYSSRKSTLYLGTPFVINKPLEFRRGFFGNTYSCWSQSKASVNKIDNVLPCFNCCFKSQRNFSRSSVAWRHYRGASADFLYKHITEGDRSALAYSITLVESTHPHKRVIAQEILSNVLQYLRENGNNFKGTFRVGLTGPPGAGKSTLIETLGLHLTSLGHKVAVLAVDPSSAKTGGSLLGDRTRMTRLSTHQNAYVRPSPSSGTLGGVTRSTNEAVVLCEGAGYEVILIETVGVGQSEFAVADMVDMFVLMIPPAAGDELQGIKKGIVELADLILINKADGDLLPAANKIQAEYISALKLLRTRNPLWTPEVLKVSSLLNEGIENAWQNICEFRKIMQESGLLEKTRKQQYKTWMWNHIRDHIMDRFRNDPRIKAKVGAMEGLVAQGVITPGMAADRLMGIFTSR